MLRKNRKSITGFLNLDGNKFDRPYTISVIGLDGQ